MININNETSIKHDITLYKYRTDDLKDSYFTKEELISKGLEPVELLYLPVIKYYRFLFGKKDVIFYCDSKSLYYGTYEDEKELVFNQNDSLIENKYIWENYQYLNIKTYLNEAKKRLVNNKDVVLGIVVKDDNILIIKRKKDASNLSYAFPGGEVEDNETKIEASEREIKEETGIDAKVKRIIGERIHPKTGRKITYYLMEYISGQITIEESEIEEAIFVNKNEISNFFSEIYEPVKKYLK